MDRFKYFPISISLLLLLFPTGIKAQSNELFSTEKIPVNLTLKIGDNSYELSESDIASWVTEKTELSSNFKYDSEIENSDFCIYNKSLICRLTFPYKNQGHIQRIYARKTNQESILNFIKDLSRKFNKDPENAKLKMEDGRVTVFSLSAQGVRLNEEKSLRIVEEYLSQENYSGEIELPYEKIDPEISTDSIDNLGIKELIGEGESDFRGSTKNRIFNINVATSRFNGLLIKPGEEFSFVKNLGEVDGEHGYKEELVIKKDKTEPEFGGGICQVSTTAFRAAIYSGLEITARRNHAYPVSYYNPQGMDATVYVPKPDLRFINNTPDYILIETRIEGTKLFFDFFGTNDGRKTEVIGPKILERNPDGSMKTTFTQKVFDESGNLVHEDVFASSYDSPSKYPHPATSSDILTQKPKDWSDKEWKDYKKAHGI